MSTKEKVVSNMMWRLFERFGAQGVSLIVSIVLARLLDPSVYGTVALVTVFTAILQIFVDSGLASALIQKKNADDIDFSTVFYFNIIFCLLLYGLMFFSAPLIASFYGMEDLTPIVRIMSLTILISGVKNVQQAYVSRNLMFKRFFWATLGGTLGSAVLGIWMAYRGYGVWALVVQNLFNQAVDTIILWITVKWRPKAIFSFQRLKILFSFGWKLLIARLVETTYSQCRSLIIGKKYTATDLAYYNKGRQFPDLLVTNIDSAIESVLFPVMSQKQDDKNKFRSMLQMSIKITTFIVCPMMIGLIACADTFVEFLLTAKWLPCVPYLRIIAISFIFFAFNTVNMNSYRSSGRSDIYLKVEIIRKIYCVIVLIVSIPFGMLAIVIGELIGSLGSMIITAVPNKKLINYGFLDQLKDIMPTLIMSVLMGGAVFSLSFLPFNKMLILCLQVILGVIIYVVFSILIAYQPFLYLSRVIAKFLPYKLAKKVGILICKLESKEGSV